MFFCYSREASVPPGHSLGEAEAGARHPDHSDPEPGPEPDLQAPGLHAGLLHNRQTLISTFIEWRCKGQVIYKEYWFIKSREFSEMF